MKYHIHPFASPAVAEVITLVLKKFGHEVVTLEESDVVVAMELRDLLTYLKSGKKVVQLYMNAHQAATGLTTAPAYVGRAWVFNFLEPAGFLEFLKKEV